MEDFAVAEAPFFRIWTYTDHVCPFIYGFDRRAQQDDHNATVKQLKLKFKMLGNIGLRPKIGV